MDVDKPAASNQNDAALDELVRAHFAAERQRVPVPSFTSVMAEAETGAAARQANAGAHSSATSGAGFDWIRKFFTASRPIAAWAGAGVIAMGLAVYLMDPDNQSLQSFQQMADQEALAGLPDAVAISQQELVRDLNRTIRWQAPSDRWLLAEADLDVLGLPDLRSPVIDPQEKKTWL